MEDLSKRTMRCSYNCGTAHKPSNEKAPFFEYRGNGSRYAEELCKCGYAKRAHDEKHPSAKVCSNFKPRGPHEYDSYYCGCQGWD